MKETDLNRIIFNTIEHYGGFAHKISDASPTQKPFDGVAAYQGNYWNIESKLIKGDLTSFNFNLLEDHQIRNLTTIQKVTDSKNIKCVVAVGYYVPRKLFGMFLIDIGVITLAKEKGINSFKMPVMKQLFSCGKMIIFNSIKENGKTKYRFPKEIVLEDYTCTHSDFEGIL